MATLTVFSDVNTFFGVNTDPVLVTNAAAIENNITNILNTVVGTYPWNRSVGANLLPLVFDPANATNAASIRLFLLQALTKYEPRATFHPMETVVALLDTGDGYAIVIPYSLPSFNYVGSYSAVLTR